MVCADKPSVKTNKKPALSCRLHTSLEGLEWFIYNRTAAYDNIVNAMESSAPEVGVENDARPSLEGIGSLRKIFSWSSAIPESMSSVHSVTDELNM